MSKQGVVALGLSHTIFLISGDAVTASVSLPSVAMDLQRGAQPSENAAAQDFSNVESLAFDEGGSAHHRPTSDT